MQVGQRVHKALKNHDSNSLSEWAPSLLRSPVVPDERHTFQQLRGGEFL